MGIPYTLNDSLRCHDKAVMDWLGGCLINYGEIAGTTRNPWPIISVFASPDRAFAETATMLVRTGFIDGTTPAAQQYNAKYENWPVFPLPIISVVRQDPMFEPELSGVPKFMTRDYVDPITGAFIPYQWPARYRVTYRFTIWSLKRATQGFVLEWFYNQLGQVGMGSREVLLEVDQGPPFGKTKAPLRFDSSVDLSDLEGGSQRYIRSELSLALRMNVFRQSPAIVDPNRLTPTVYSIQLENSVVQSSLDPGDSEVYPNSGVHTTSNLFTLCGPDEDIVTLWPVSGNATVSRALQYDPENDKGLSLTVTAPTDIVPLTRRMCVPIVNLGGISIQMAAFNYASDAPWSLTAQQYDLTNVATPLHSFSYPANTAMEPWRSVQVFALCLGNQFEWDIVGAGAAASMTLGSIDVRQCYGTTAVVPASYGINGGHRYYNWVNLSARPYLVICVFPTTGVITADTAELDNDTSAPTLTSTQPFLATSVGVVIMAMPCNDSLTLRIPQGIVPTAVYALAFDGPALPCSIQP